MSTSTVPIWHHDDGEPGEPLLLVGGFTAGHFAFDFVRSSLGSYRLITWEPRGLGRSARPDPRNEPYTPEIWAEDLRALLDAIGVERAHIWAAGFGSYIALCFAALHPERTGALITYTDVFAADETKGYAKIWEVYSAIVRNFGTKDFGARVLANVFDMSDVPWFGRWETRNIEEVLHPDTVEATVGYCLLEADVRDALSSIGCPTLVMQGDRTWDGRAADLQADPSLSLMRSRIARLEIESISGAHPAYVLVEHPERCAEAANRFLARHPLA